MTDDQTKNQQADLKQDQHVSTDVPERPIDPSRNAQDMFNDTQGMSGVTQGGLEQSSTEPQERLEDTTFIKGGVIQNPPHPSPAGYPKSAIGQDEYKEEVREGMSSVSRSAATDIASGISDQTAPTQPSPTSQQDIKLTPGGDGNDTQAADTEHAVKTGVSSAMGDQDGSRFINTQDAPYVHPENTGEEDAVGGTTPDPRTDDDTLEMAQRTGFQTDEDPEHPQPVDAARDIDQAEENIS